MIIKEDFLNYSCTYDTAPYFSLEEALFFDIETTGFSVRSSSIYLIGCTYYKDNVWYYKQWLAESTSEEAFVISDFVSFANEFSILLHYNGSRFDVRFIQEKIRLLKLNISFDFGQSIDLYKIAFSLRRVLKLVNLKQRTLEDCFGYHREDGFSGQELINVYQAFVTTKQTKTMELLLLHNHDDLLGMLHLLPLLTYLDFFSGEFEIGSANVEYERDFDGNRKPWLLIYITLHSPLPARFTYIHDLFFLTAADNRGVFRINIYNGTLKLFFTDYKSYFYLPAEDTAIHKSVAAYVDKEHRNKAKASTAYVKKDGSFLPQLTRFFEPALQKEYHDKVYYFTFTNDLTNDHEVLKQYLLHLMEDVKCQKIHIHKKEPAE